jgi:hypothetical protein
VDSPAVRDALAARLEDVDDDTRCEALFGLAVRGDPRARLRVRAALARPSGQLWFLEFRAAGALGDPSLHELVLEHAQGWPDNDAVEVEAVVRLTDPAGLGQDLIRGLAEYFRRQAQGRASEVANWWPLVNDMLELAPHRTAELSWAVLPYLADDPDLARRWSAQFDLDVEREGTTRPEPG